MDYKKLDELYKFYQSGALTKEEFQNEKEKILNEKEEAGTKGLPMGLGEDSYLALMNFLILVPYIGWIFPIILWSIGKNYSNKVNKQGTFIFNWYITWLSWALIITLCIGIGYILIAQSLHSSLLSTLMISTGGCLLIIIAILRIVFPIIGGIQGLNGKAWKYPLSIPFLK